MNPTHLSVVKVRQLLLVAVPAEPDDQTVSALQDRVLRAARRYP
jgi:hypothetical protein